MDVTRVSTSPRQAEPITLNDLLVRPEFATVLRENGLDSIDALFALQSDTSLGKPGLDPWRERLRVTLRDGAGSRVVYIKRYTNPPPHAVREARRAGARSVAGVEWHWTARLARDGVPAVEAVALGEEFCGARETRSVLVTVAVPGESLETRLSNGVSGRNTNLQRWLAPVARLVSKLHRLGYVHRDLYLCHIFLDQVAVPDAALRFIDVQRMMRPTWNMRRWIVKDLAALNYSTPCDAASTADRVRWLRCYLGKTRLDAESRRLLYRVVGKTQQIARHDARRRGRLDPGQTGGVGGE